MLKANADTPAKIVWHDACGGKTGWMDRAQATGYRPYEVVSHGWLIRNDKAGVTLAISRHARADGGYDYADTLDVPRGMVKSITKLRR